MSKQAECICKWNDKLSHVYTANSLQYNICMLYMNMLCKSQICVCSIFYIDHTNMLAFTSNTRTHTHTIVKRIDVKFSCHHVAQDIFT